jgi:hypothetical protein
VTRDSWFTWFQQPCSAAATRCRNRTAGGILLIAAPPSWSWSSLFFAAAAAVTVNKVASSPQSTRSRLLLLPNSPSLLGFRSSLAAAGRNSDQVPTITILVARMSGHQGAATAAPASAAYPHGPPPATAAASGGGGGGGGGQPQRGHQHHPHPGGGAQKPTTGSGGGSGGGASGAAAGGGGGGAKAPRRSSGQNKSHSRSYPRGVGLDFRKLAGLTLLSYIDHHGALPLRALQQTQHRSYSSALERKRCIPLGYAGGEGLGARAWQSGRYCSGLSAISSHPDGRLLGLALSRFFVSCPRPAENAKINSRILPAKPTILGTRRRRRPAGRPSQRAGGRRRPAL